MIAHELRIGNYVDYPLEGYDSIHKVTVYTLKDLDNCNKDIKPIPLTEEILLKCGFENKMNLMYISIFEGMLCISINDFSYGLYSTEQRFNIGLSYTNSSKIEYLHQLQNLYWSLTQKELQIEL